MGLLLARAQLVYLGIFVMTLNILLIVFAVHSQRFEVHQIYAYVLNVNSGRYIDASHLTAMYLKFDTCIRREKTYK